MFNYKGFYYVRFFSLKNFGVIRNIEEEIKNITNTYLKRKKFEIFRIPVVNCFIKFIIIVIYFN